MFSSFFSEKDFSFLGFYWSYWHGEDFFFFFLTMNKKSQMSLYTFFLIQSSSSICWLSSYYLYNLNLFEKEDLFSMIIEMLVIGSLIMKMGMFSGHIWSWQIYNTEMLWPISLVSTLLKMIPLMLLSHYVVFMKTSEIMKIFIILTMAMIFYNSWNSSSIFFIMFISGMMQYSSIIFALMMKEVNFSFVYMISYWMTFFIFFYLIEVKKIKMFNNSISTSTSMMKGENILMTMIISGFPPTGIFFLKLVFIFNLKFSIISPFSFIILVSMFFYLSFLLFTFFRQFFFLNLNLNIKSIKFYYSECFYVSKDQGIFLWIFFFFSYLVFAFLF
uniref:NADH dehydrogenase subunit 2 n=1 Tax=Symsagittifera roscoffensis TaxID=84072 RepID=E3UFE8_SYMRO|nr:NADH dehydrogenase subunit 2 [Symsagittifera roscoffensis]ADI75247.1 NADH dehydrogenase subunit 2 [Symsagittifera roscoffensis]